MFSTEVAVHGGAGGHLSPTEVTRLGFHLFMSQMDVLLQHVLSQVLLVTCRTRPRLPHCGEKIGYISPDANINIYVSLFLPHCRQRHLVRCQTSKRFCEGPGNGFDCDVRVLPV